MLLSGGRGSVSAALEKELDHLEGGRELEYRPWFSTPLSLHYWGRAHLGVTSPRGHEERAPPDAGHA